MRNLEDKQIRFCPMCGWPVGDSVSAKFIKELNKIFQCQISVSEVCNYVGTIGWKTAKDRVSELRYLSDNKILERYFTL